jgi:uncharacterized protein YciI
MYALAVIRYRKPFEAVEKVLAAHRTYLAGLQAQGLLLRVPDADPDRTLDRIRDEDPFTRAGVAQYELLPWAPVLGQEGLDRL